MDAITHMGVVTRSQLKALRTVATIVNGDPVLFHRFTAAANAAAYQDDPPALVAAPVMLVADAALAGGNDVVDAIIDAAMVAMDEARHQLVVANADLDVARHERQQAVFELDAAVIARQQAEASLDVALAQRAEAVARSIALDADMLVTTKINDKHRALLRSARDEIVRARGELAAANAQLESLARDA
jgi:hypothetical protein